MSGYAAQARLRRRARCRDRSSFFPLAFTKELEELHPLAEAPLHHLTVADHAAQQREHLARPEIEAPVELIHGLEHHRRVEAGIVERGVLNTVVIHEITALRLEPAVLLRLLVEISARIRRGE